MPDKSRSKTTNQRQKETKQMKPKADRKHQGSGKTGEKKKAKVKAATKTPELDGGGRWIQPDPPAGQTAQVMFTPQALCMQLRGVSFGLTQGDGEVPISPENGLVWKCTKESPPPERLHINFQVDQSDLAWIQGKTTRKVLACVPFLIDETDRGIFPIELDENGCGNVFVPVDKDGNFYRTDGARNYVMFVVLTDDGFVTIVSISLRVIKNDVIMFKQATRLVKTYRNGEGKPEVPAFTRPTEPKPRWEAMNRFVATTMGKHPEVVANLPSIDDWVEVQPDISSLKYGEVLITWATARRWVAGGILGQDYKTFDEDAVDSAPLVPDGPLTLDPSNAVGEVIVPAGTHVRVPLHKLQLPSGFLLVFEGMVVKIKGLKRPKDRKQPEPRLGPNGELPPGPPARQSRKATSFEWEVTGGVALLE